MKATFEICNNDYLVRDHRAHGVRLVPGVTFLDLIYRTAAALQLDQQSIAIRKMVFHQPIVTTETFDQAIEVIFENNDQHSKIKIRSQKIKGTTVLDGIWTDNAECELILTNIDSLSKRQIDIDKLKLNAKRSSDLSKMYDIARQVGIEHYEFMKVPGKLYEGENFLFAEMELSSLAQEHLEDFYLHPAFLDAATVMSCITVDIINDFEGKPYIPISIDQFSAVRSTPRKVVVYIDLAQKKFSKTRDVFFNDIEIFDEQGRFIARFDRIAAKRIRNEELIRKLEKPSSNILLERSEENSILTSSVNELTKETEWLIRVEKDLQALVARYSNLPLKQINVETGFYDLGLDSIHLT
ncbi:MAG TPA: polyketide synthase dehydratase domain-containing protein, partial [Flavitalea sp.]|nr:polyketide synthase dehydratase domain-containing protein [Flavitalea sp.]